MAQVRSLRLVQGHDGFSDGAQTVAPPLNPPHELRLYVDVCRDWLWTEGEKRWVGMGPSGR